MVINVEPLNDCVPLLVGNEFLMDNIANYNYALECIFKNIELDDYEKEDNADSIIKLSNYLDYVCDFADETSLAQFLCLSFDDLYTLKCDYNLDVTFGPLNYDLINIRHYLSKTDAFCIKIIYSMYHWYNYNKSFVNVLGDLGIDYKNEHIPVLKRYLEHRYIKFLSEHKSKDENLNELFIAAYTVFVNNPPYEKLLSSDYSYDDYNVGCSFEGFVNFDSFEGTVNDLIDDYIKQTDEACYSTLSNTVRFDIKHMITSQDYSVDFTYFLQIVDHYLYFIHKWNAISYELKNKIQYKLDLWT